MKKRITELMDMFPYFFDKSETSNFFKSQSVTNNQLLKIYQSLLTVKDSLSLDKKCLIWKEQTVPYDYTINFLVNYPYLKSVKCYKNDNLIYMEEYLEEDNISSFIYSYNSNEENGISNETVEDTEEENEDTPIIPTDTFKIIAETYNEYTIEKGFPENDEILGDIYDHDISLDEIGALNDIPRKTYITTEDYANTEPPYNNRLTEDDYHYMNRILNYNLKLHNTPLPVLEIWKLYGIFSDMVNREQYLLKMFDETMHPYDEETGLVGDWTPMPWEHKDTLCNLTPDLGRFFFVSANTLLPVKNQNVRFNFKYLNNLAEELSGEYTVTIFLNDDEEPLVTNFTGSQYTVDSTLLEDDAPNAFVFIAYEGETEFAREELNVTVRGCTTADWYVSPNGDDTNDGKTNQTPFQNISKALSSVNGEENLIVLMSGTHNINTVLSVPYSCTLLGCGSPTVNSTNRSFFNVLQNKTLTIQDVTLSYDTNQALVNNTVYTNNNKNNNGLYVVIGERDKLTSYITLTSNKQSYLTYETITVSGLLTGDENTALSGKTVKIYVGSTLVDTVTTTGNGNYTSNITLTDVTGEVTIRAVFEGDEEYYSCTNSVTVTISEPAPDSITLVAEKPIMSKGENNKITATVLDSEGNPCVGETVSFSVVDGEDLGTAVTDSSGEASVYYLGKGVGDLNIKAECMFVSKIYEVIDAKYYNDGSSVNGLTSQTNVSTTSDGEWITITTSTSGEKYVLSPVNVSSSDNWEMSLKIKLTNSQNCAFNLLNENSFSLFNNVYMNITGSMFYFRLDGGTAQQISHTFQDNDKITIRRQNGSWIILHNDEQVYTKSYSWSGTKTIGWYTNQNRIQIMKEIIIKPL